MTEPLLIIVAAPSGGGKSTVVKRLFEEVPDLLFSISHTTRPPRRGEEHGREYFFVDEGAMRELIARDAFLEWADVHGCLYGTARAELDRARALGKDLVLDIDVQGAAQILAAYPNVISVFLRPPSVEVLRHRLRGRGSESPESLALRLANAAGEVDRASEFRHVVVNDRLEETVAAVKKIILNARATRDGADCPTRGVEGDTPGQTVPSVILPD